MSDFCCCCCCKTKPKLTVILAWIQTVVYTITCLIVLTAIFFIFLTDDYVDSASLFAVYFSKFAAVPVNLINELLMAVSIVQNNGEISVTLQETRITRLVFCFILLLFLLPAVVSGIILLKEVEQVGAREYSRCAIHTWTIFAAVWFILSVMEIVAGGYINGILSMIAYAIAIWIVHKEKRKMRDLMNQIV